MSNTSVRPPGEKTRRRPRRPLRSLCTTASVVAVAVVTAIVVLTGSRPGARIGPPELAVAPSATTPASSAVPVELPMGRRIWVYEKG